ncbi:MAG: NAD-dependent epimerase/dehydratase family protein [Stenotrophomonas rhizophila]|uniref:NAD-dependent epimerase/dehydratase family protein n=1 Tax=Stenotrophomonas rhizophila TaxID=216778 RepID=UPI003D148256
MASRSELSGCRVLVTGASGFTGRYVAAAFLANGCEIVPFAHPAGGPVDLLDRAAVAEAVAAARPDVVVHLAAIAFVAHGDVEEIYRVNVVGTRNLLDALSRLEQPPRHVLLASSANVYGNTEGRLAETSPPAPVNDYAVSKYAMELMARQFAGVLPMTFVRPFNYTGVGQADRFLIPKIVGHFKRREARLELGNLDVARDFNDVRNVAESYVRLAALPGMGDAVNLCSGQAHSLMDVVGMMRDIAGYAPEIVVNPAFVRENEVRILVGDPSRFDAMVGGLPRIELAQTLEWMYLND